MTTTFPLCNGDPIHVSGPLLAVFSETTTPSGGEVFAFHFQPQGVTGVDLVTGAVFHATGLTRDLIVNSPPGGSTETFVNQFHIQATGGGESFIISELFHVTVHPRRHGQGHSSTTSRPPADPRLAERGVARRFIPKRVTRHSAAQKVGPGQ